MDAGSATPGGPSYVHGGGGILVSGTLVAQVLGALTVIGLLVLAAWLAVAATTQSSQRGKLAHHGVAVQATVTDCIGISAGIGQAIQGYSCRGRYSLDGQTFVETIRGPDVLRPVGAKVDAVAVPGDPGLLTAAGSVPPVRGWWVSYELTVLLGGLAVVVAILAIGFSRWRPPSPAGAGSSFIR